MTEMTYKEKEQLAFMKNLARMDAYAYNEDHAAGRTDHWMNVPPKRYLTPSVQMTYANYFWDYLRDIRSESVAVEGTEGNA